MTKDTQVLYHDHTFRQGDQQQGERKTIWVFALTALMMVIEVAGGLLFGSMALLADGLHMGSHATAMGIAVIAYVYARKRADDTRFSFGTGKVNSLAAFTSALLLVVFALMMVHESIDRFIHPVHIDFNQAIIVTVIGFVVNLVSVLILGESGHSHDHSGHHHHEHEGEDDNDHHDHDHHSGSKDQNLKAAYLHVLADTMTSVFAILALLAGKFFGLNWLDPLMGIAGAVLVASWARGLLRDTSQVLLDHQGPQHLRHTVMARMEEEKVEVVDLHLWAIGPDQYSLAVSLLTAEPKATVYYKSLAQVDERIVHTTIEVHER